ncbi:hypothetical protein BH23ACT12_BH23ACT12_03270 [soil metagenome]
MRRLVEAMLADPEGCNISLILSRRADPPASCAQVDKIRLPLGFAPLYAAWNYLGRPGIAADLDVVHATGLAIPRLGGPWFQPFTTWRYNECPRWFRRSGVRSI